jgi:membrane protein implicated in regulation of membrane protease activity
MIEKMVIKGYNEATKYMVERRRQMESWFWLIIALVALIVEITSVGSLISIWFALGALLAFIAALLGLGWPVEIIFFIFGTIVSIIGLRPFVLKFIQPNTTNTNADRLIGKKTKITETVLPDHWGAIVLNGIRYSAKNLEEQTLEVDTEVEVVALEGAKLVVKAIRKGD